MPNKPFKPCPGKGPRRGGCPNLIKAGDLCCEECMPFVKKANKEYDKQRDQTPERQFLHSRAWRKVRDMYLNMHPLCEECLSKGKTIQAYLVHHIDRNELNNSEDNLEALCDACHEEEHRDERWGK